MSTATTKPHKWQPVGGVSSAVCRVCPEHRDHEVHHSAPASTPQPEPRVDEEGLPFVAPTDEFYRAPPTGDAACANHCGHVLEWMQAGRCVWVLGRGMTGIAICGHRCVLGEAAQTCPGCGHDKKHFRVNDDPRAIASGELEPQCWHEDEDGFCGHRCTFPAEATAEVEAPLIDCPMCEGCGKVEKHDAPPAKPAPRCSTCDLAHPHWQECAEAVMELAAHLNKLAAKPAPVLCVKCGACQTWEGSAYCYSCTPRTEPAPEGAPRITAEMLLEQLRFVPDLVIASCCESHVLEILKTAIVNARADGHDETQPTTRVSPSTDDYTLAKEDHAYAVGFQAGLILATTEEQSRVHALDLAYDDYSEDYKRRIATIESQRAESLKVIKRCRVAPSATPSAAEICAEMAREAAMRAAKCRSEASPFEFEIIQRYEAESSILREAQRRIEASTPSATGDWEAPSDLADLLFRFAQADCARIVADQKTDCPEALPWVNWCTVCQSRGLIQKYGLSSVLPRRDVPADSPSDAEQEARTMVGTGPLSLSAYGVDVLVEHITAALVRRASAGQAGLREALEITTRYLNCSVNTAASIASEIRSRLSGGEAVGEEKGK